MSSCAAVSSPTVNSSDRAELLKLNDQKAEGGSIFCVLPGAYQYVAEASTGCVTINWWQ